MDNTEQIRSDINAVEQCKKWLEETQNYTSVEISHHPTDIEGVDPNGKTVHIEVKMTGKDDYFGAATITEWGVVLDDILKFVIARKDDTNKYGYRFYMIEAEEFYQISTVPPFKINFNIKESDYSNEKSILSLNRKRKRRKGTIELNESIVRVMRDIYELLQDKDTMQELIATIEKVNNKKNKDRYV